MDIPVEHDSFRARRLAVRTAGFWKGARVLVDGAVASGKRLKYEVNDDQGRLRAVVLKPLFLDPIPRLQIDSEPVIELARPLRWYEWAWMAFPMLLPTLYTTPVSANGRKALAVAEHLSVGLEINSVNVYRGEGRAEWYLRVNPQGKVPTLVDGDLLADFAVASMTTYFQAADFPDAHHPSIAASLRRMSEVPAWAATLVEPWKMDVGSTPG